MRRFVPALFLWGVALCRGAENAPPTPFHFPNFGKHAHLNVKGNAHFTSSVLRLTDARNDKAGSAWYDIKEPVASGFDTTFRFQLTKQGGLGRGADGLAFVLQNSGPRELAGRGSAGGWGAGDGHRRATYGIPRAIAVFFDTYRNAEDEDPSDNYIGIFNNGGPRNMLWPPPRVAYTTDLRVVLKDRNVHTARVLYRPPVLSVYLDDSSTAVLVTPIDISIVGDEAGRAWVGFTASTGGGYENHDLLSWTFNATEVTSGMVSANISFFMDRCQPGHNLCTPDRAIIDDVAPGRYHVVLPANVEWGASVPNPSGLEVDMDDVRGTVCWDLKAHGPEGCSGPDGSPKLKGGLDRSRLAGALIVKTERGRTYFSVNDTDFADNEGYYEFDVIVGRPTPR